MKHFTNTILASLFIVAGCATEIPVALQSSCATPATSTTSTLTGNDVPEMQTLVDEAKFDYFINNSTTKIWTWNNRFPRPQAMRIDDLTVVEITATGMTPRDMIKEIDKEGYSLANSHESVVFATQNPDLQSGTNYYYADRNSDEADRSIWIKFRHSTQFPRIVEITTTNMKGQFLGSIWVVVHQKH